MTRNKKVIKSSNSLNQNNTNMDAPALATVAKSLTLFNPDDDSLNIRVHFSRLELLQRVQSWSEADLFKLAQTTFLGRAFEHMAYINAQNYADLKASLIAKYENACSQNVLISQLLALRQNDMSVRDFTNKIDNLAARIKLSCDEGVAPSILLSAFMAGIKPMYKNSLVILGIDTYDQAVKKALSIEAHCLSPDDMAGAQKPTVKVNAAAAYDSTVFPELSGVNSGFASNDVLPELSGVNSRQSLIDSVIAALEHTNLNDGHLSPPQGHSAGHWGPRPQFRRRGNGRFQRNHNPNSSWAPPPHSPGWSPGACFQATALNTK